MRKRGGFLGGRLLTMALACVLASSTCVAVAMGADTAPSTEPAKIATGGGALSSTPDDQSADDADAGISAQDLNLTPEELEKYTVAGCDPADTTVNLFDYTTGKTRTLNPGTANEVKTDLLGSTGFVSPYENYTTWLTGDNNINRGHLLTFGDGMRHLGYWNQGITSGYGDLGLKRPGMQSIVAPFLWNDYPIVNDTPADKEGEEGALGGYNTNPSLYNSASRNNERIYADAGPLWTGGWQVY